jgi:hypothetical protein
LQWNGEPMRDLHGVAATKYVRDARGYEVDESNLGLDGKPIAGNDGVYRTHHERDASGNTTVERYFGVDDKPVASTKGCHGRRFERDARNLVVRITCVGADNKPSNDTTNAAFQEFTYDARGCQVGMRYHGAPGTESPQDHGVDYVVDENCAATVHTCVNVKADRRACGTGEPARYDYKRDGAGNIISTKYFNVDGTPTKDPVYGGYEMAIEYDKLDNEISRACFDSAGKPMQCGTLGFHRHKSERDDAGHEVARTFLDEHGASALNLSAHTRKFRFDNYDHMYESTGYDIKGNVVEGLGMATRRDLYDSAHRLFGVVLLDRNGKPAHFTGCYAGSTCPKAGWHAVRIVRRADGDAQTNQFFDQAGQLIETADCKKVRCFK